MPTALNKPTMLRPNFDIAPLAALAVDVGSTTEALGVDDEPEPAVVEVVELLAVAFAAAWKAEKDFVAVGLIAKTIPCAQ